MNILLLSNHLNIGGITSYIVGLSRQLTRRGHRVFVASSGGRLEKRISENGADFIPVPLKTKCEISPRVFFSFLKLDGLLKQKDINLIHANTRVTTVLAYLLSRRWKVPYLSTCHGFFKRRLFRRIFPLWGKRVIAISQEVKRHLIDDFKVEQHRVKLVYNGIDTKNKPLDAREKTTARQNLGLRDTDTIGIIARLSDVKGHRFLIEAMSEVVKTHPSIQLLIVGEGKEKKRLIDLVQRLGLTANIIFIPALEDVSKIFAAIDLFVMPSIHEGLGFSVIEAMASGVCVIASDVGGIRDLIKDGFNGVLVPSQDSPTLSRSIMNLLNDRIRLKDYGIKAKESIAEKFSLERMALETEGVYLECLNAKL